MIGFLFFSPTSIVVLQTFVCETFEDGTQALVADSSIECYTPTHIWSIFYATIMVFVYPVGTCCGNELGVAVPSLLALSLFMICLFLNRHVRFAVLLCLSFVSSSDANQPSRFVGG